MIELRGIGGVPGLAIGPIAQFRPSDNTFHTTFAELRDRALDELDRLAERLRSASMPAEAAIFDAQAMLIVDPALENAVNARTQQDMSLPDAIREAVAELVDAMETFPEPHLRERAGDVRAVGALLLSDGMQASAHLHPGSILVAGELAPSDLLKFPVEQLGGIVTGRGSATDHTAILARSLGIPAALGVGLDVTNLPDGMIAILDGGDALLICDPNAATLAYYTQLRQELAAESQPLARLAELPAETVDGRRIALFANIGAPEEVSAALAAGAEGIGLFRTEFLFLRRAEAPDENEQYRIYTHVLQQMVGRPVVMRTLDIGGDKIPSYLPPLPEANPFLGERGIRFSRHYPALFRTQLRALLRAAVVGDLRIMLPMIATVEDVQWARGQVMAAADSLVADAIEHRSDVPLGIMIETPAAVVMANRLAEEAAFFSIGSNDLAQYALAADRTLADIARRYRHNDPAIFRLIALARGGVRDTQTPVSVCGELAADPDCAEVLLGLGIDELSMAPSAIVAVKKRIRSTTLAAATSAARAACNESIV